MSPRPNTKVGRKRAMVAAGVVGVVVATVWGVVGSYVNTVPTPDSSVGISLVATRDLDQVAPCDLPAGGTADNAPLIADQSWTRTGGSSCYPISATSAQCFTAAEVPYTVDATGLGWVLPGAGLINRVRYSTAINCTNWTCRGTGTATDGNTDPSGGSGASAATIGVFSTNDIYINATGYGSPSAVTLYPRVWVRCSSGTLYIANPQGTSIGRWAVNCATVGGVWTLIDSESTAKSELNAWSSTAGGVSGIQLYTASGTVDASVFAPTLTEDPGIGTEVIPTAAAAVDTGTATWTIDNTSGRYWQTGWTLLESITTHDGTSWHIDGTTIYITGATGAERTSVLYSLEAHP